MVLLSHTVGFDRNQRAETTSSIILGLHWGLGSRSLSVGSFLMSAGHHRPTLDRGNWNRISFECLSRSHRRKHPAQNQLSQRREDLSKGASHFQMQSELRMVWLVHERLRLSLTLLLYFLELKMG